MFKAIRIIILLVVLASVTSNFLLQQKVVRDWNGSLDIRIIPVLSDQKDQTFHYVNSLQLSDFESIENYLISQAKSFNIDLESSFNIRLEDVIKDSPPEVPDTQSSRFEIAIWSLKLKWWAWKNRSDDHHVSQIRMYVLYQSPDNSQPLPHSTGLRNGLIGLVNARAQQSQRSLHPVIITHELLHIFGATDKYDIGTGQPIYPDGFAEPNKRSLYPQRYAEIMGRAIPVTDNKFDVASRLNQTKIASKTAQEIGWINMEHDTK